MSLHFLHHHTSHPAHRVAFDEVDPLGDGLREDILAEQAEPEHIVLELRPDEGELENYLKVLTDDNDQINFSEG